jgi:hypothetical protein
MTDSEFDAKLEKKLDGIFNPVSPRSSYVDDLQKRLTANSDVAIEYPNYFILGLVLSSGLLIGLLLFTFLNKIFKIISGKK